MRTHKPLLFGSLPYRAIPLIAWSAGLLVPYLVAAGPDQTGEQIYRHKCASCHGATGEGTDDQYPRRPCG